MIEEKSTLLIVEDDVDVADMLKAYFLVQGYRILVANWGEDAVRICQEEPVDLVLLDIRLPDIDGFEVATRLRSQGEKTDVPIIFLTEHREKHFRVRGLELEAQDFITKPFEIEELRLRIRNVLRYHHRLEVRNKDTSLPQGDLVDERLAQWINEPAWSLLLLRLIHLEQFRQVFGYSACSDLLRFIGNLLRDTLERLKIEGFLGHFSESEFILIVPANSTPLARKHLQRRLAKAFQYLTEKGDSKTAIWDVPSQPYQISVIPHAAGIDSLAALKLKLHASEARS